MHSKHLILAVLVTAVWGLNFPVTQLGLASIDPLLLTALRFTLAALAWVCVLTSCWPPTRCSCAVVTRP